MGIAPGLLGLFLVSGEQLLGVQLNVEGDAGRSELVVFALPHVWLGILVASGRVVCVKSGRVLRFLLSLRVGPVMTLVIVSLVILLQLGGLHHCPYPRGIWSLVINSELHAIHLGCDLFDEFLSEESLHVEWEELSGVNVSIEDEIDLGGVALALTLLFTGTVGLDIFTEQVVENSQVNPFIPALLFGILEAGILHHFLLLEGEFRFFWSVPAHF